MIPAITHTTRPDSPRILSPFFRQGRRLIAPQGQHANTRRRVVARLVSVAAICLTIFAVNSPSVSTASGQTKASGNFAAAKLVWQSGDSIPGEIKSFADNKLRWQAGTLFGQPIEIDAKFLRRIEFPISQPEPQSAQPFIVQLIDGMSMTGEILALDEKALTIKSDRFGEVEIDRKRVATILNLENSGSLINGRFDLDKWDAHRGEKKYWEVDEQGALQSARKNIHLFFKSELPDSVLIELEIGWEKSLDFSFGFGVPDNARKIGDLPRLESWDGAIVLSFGDDFETVLESVDDKAKRLKLLIHWNRSKHQIVIHDEKGRQLAQAKLGKPGKKTSAGIFIENKSGDLSIPALALRNSTADFDATRPSIQQLNESTTNAELKSFDGKFWRYALLGEATDGEDDAETSEEAETTEVAAANFCGAFLVNPGVDQITGESEIRFSDGMLISGQLQTIAVGKATIKTNFSSAPVSLGLDGISFMQFPPSDLDRKEQTRIQKEQMVHRLYTRAGEIHGRLEQGSGTAGDVVRWRVQGATEAVPFNSGDARIVLKKRKSVAAASSKSFGDTLYLTNRDIVPCRIEGMDEKTIRIEAFVENEQIDQSLVKAVDFRSVIVAETLAVDDPDWAVGKKSKGKFKIKNDAISVIRKAKFGHPQLLATGKVEFDLTWRKDQYGVLQCQALIGDLADKDGGKKFNIVIYGETIFAAAANQTEPNQTQIPAAESKAHVTIEYRLGKISVYLNKKRAWTSKVQMGQSTGRGLKFTLKDLYSQDIRCTFSNFKLRQSASGNSTHVDPHRKNLMLTVPRLKRLNPPGQIVCATNGDMLRGDLLAMDGQSVRFRANHEDQRFSRNIVESIVWLHAEGLAKRQKKSDATEEKNEAAENGPTASSDKPDNQQVQILMSGNRRMTARIEAWKDDTLFGQSTTLGQCQVPMDQIYELRMGSYAKEANDVPYADWIATLAPEPKMEATAPDGSSGMLFGESSPLIGTAPKSFTATMIDGKKITLKSLKGKVVVLDFWATWCGPCVQALPAVIETVNAYPADKVAFLTLNQEEGVKTVRQFMTARNLEFPVALDSGAIGKQFALESLPLTIIIDADGMVAFVKTGSGRNDEAKLKAAIDHLLSGEVPESPEANASNTTNVPDASPELSESTDTSDLTESSKDAVLEF